MSDPRPHRRPPLALRLLVGLCGLGAAAATTALMLSDTAPGVLRRLFGEFAVRLSARLDAGRRAQLVELRGDPRLPASDSLVHIGLWAGVMVLAGLTVWSLRWLVPLAAAVGSGSIVVELLQGRVTTTRGVEARDVAANLVGVGLGVALCLALYATWSAIATVLTPRRRP